MRSGIGPKVCYIPGRILLDPQIVGFLNPGNCYYQMMGFDKSSVSEVGKKRGMSEG